MDEHYILAQDIGTSAVKTTLVNQRGEIFDSAVTSHTTDHPQPGWAEQHPGDWWQGVRANTGDLMDKHPDLRKKIVGIGVTGHMLGCIPLDKYGEVLRPGMIHSDGRAREEFETIAGTVGIDRVYKTTGNILDVHSPLCKILWLKNNEPAVYRKTEKFIQCKDFVVGRLVGECTYTDYSDASHAQWLNVRDKAYARDIFRKIGIRTDIFPELCAGTEIAGTLSRSAAQYLHLPSGIPVVVGGGDGSCATVGAGAVRPGDVYCCLGTTAWVACTVQEPVIDQEHRIFNIMSLDGNNFGVFGTVQSAGHSLEWVMDLFEENVVNFDQIAGEVAPGSEGLIFLPYLEGERSPIYDADARGVFFGLNSSHRREHFIRASVEGVSFALRSVLDVLRERIDINAVRLIGGGMRSEVWQSMLADIFKATVQVPSRQSVGATSLGVAVAAGVGVGLFRDLEEAREILAIEEEIPPSSPGTERYETLFSVYNSLYPALTAPFKDLQDALHKQLRDGDFDGEY